MLTERCSDLFSSSGISTSPSCKQTKSRPFPVMRGGFKNGEFIGRVGERDLTHGNLWVFDIAKDLYSGLLLCCYCLKTASYLFGEHGNRFPFVETDIDSCPFSFDLFFRRFRCLWHVSLLLGPIS